MPVRVTDTLMDFSSQINKTGKDSDTDSDSDEHVAHTAAGTGDIPMLIRAVQNDPSILEQKDIDGLTPLTHAVNGKHLTAVKRLVKMGADVNVQDSQGRTYLSLAAYQGWYEGVVYLLKKGARQDIADRSGRTPLHAATYDKDTRCLNALLKRLSYDEMNARDKEQMTALHWSAFHDRPDHVRELLLRDINICAQDIDGKTPLHWAAQNGSRECCVLLAEHDDDSGILQYVDNSGKTPIHLAAAAGKQLVIQELAKYSPVMCETTDREERTPLHWATAMGHTDCVKTLLKLGVLPNPLDEDGKSPVQYAKKAGHKQCAILLEEATRLKVFQTNTKRSPEYRRSEHKQQSGGYFRGLFGKKHKNSAKHGNSAESSNKMRERLPSLHINGERKIIQGVNTDKYDDEISQLFKDQKVVESSVRDRMLNDTDAGMNGFVDESGYTRTPDRSNVGKKKKKKRRHKDERFSSTSSPHTAMTSTTWDEDRSTGHNSLTARITTLSPLQGSTSPRIPHSPQPGRDMIPTPRRLGELVPIRPSSLSNNVPVHNNIAVLRDEHGGVSRSPTPPPVFKNISKKKVLPDISPLTRNMNTIGLDGAVTDQTYQDDVY